MFMLASSCSLLALVIISAAGAGLMGCGAADENVDQSSQLLVTDGVEAVSTNDQATDRPSSPAACEQIARIARVSAPSRSRRRSRGASR